MDNKVDDVPNISGYTIASVLMQFLAIMFFFLALVAFMNESITTGIILLAIGVVWEILFAKLIRKIRYWKKNPVTADMNSAEEEFADPLYKNDGEGYDYSCKIYCKQYGKEPQHLTKEDKAVIYQYTCDDFSYLLMWIIEKDLYQPSYEYNEEEIEEVNALVAKIKARAALPTDFLSESVGYFMEDEVQKKARAFVKQYYEGSYRDELTSFAKEKLGAELYGFPFRWEDYDAFKPKIDEAYKKYQEEK